MGIGGDRTAGRAPPRAVGQVRLTLADGRLTGLRQDGALKALFPNRAAGEAVLINTAGGLTGGDRMDVAATVAGGVLTLTSQAAERAYASAGGLARVRTRLSAGPGGEVRWLPQETILYDRSALDRALEIDLAGGAGCVMVEALIFGRVARGERLRDARLRDRVRITRAGVPLYRDGIDLAGDIEAALARPSVADGARAMATLVLVRPDAATHLGAMRDALGGRGGASAMSDDMVVARCLGADGFDLRRALVPILDGLTVRTLPKVWRL